MQIFLPSFLESGTPIKTVCLGFKTTGEGTCRLAFWDVCGLGPDPGTGVRHTDTSRRGAALEEEKGAGRGGGGEEEEEKGRRKEQKEEEKGRRRSRRNRRKWMRRLKEFYVDKQGQGDEG